MKYPKLMYFHDKSKPILITMAWVITSQTDEVINVKYALSTNSVLEDRVAPSIKKKYLKRLSKFRANGKVWTGDKPNKKIGKNIALGRLKSEKPNEFISEISIPRGENLVNEIVLDVIDKDQIPETIKSVMREFTVRKFIESLPTRLI